MNKIQDRIVEEFGNKLRVRVCGICIKKDKILVVNHQSLNEEGDFWGPPGGGMDFGVSAEKNLKRELREETGLEVTIEKFLFVHEYLSPPLHAIELFYLIHQNGGELRIGSDPEMGKGEQIIKNVGYKSFEDIKKMPAGNYHQVFDKVTSLNRLKELSGYHCYKE